MKYKTQLHSVLLALIAITSLSVMTLFAADPKHAALSARGFAPPVMDPATGLPIAPPAEQWLDPDWQDPDKVLKSVSYEGQALSEVVVHLRDQFGDAFDVLMPERWEDPFDPARTMEPQSIPIKMQLKNVRASQVFNGMNLVFETQNTPLRWKLTMNGDRPTALLRVLPELVGGAGQRLGFNPPPPSQRTILFVGDMLGDPKLGSMSMEELVKTVSEIYQMSYSDVPSATPAKQLIQYHKEAQLLIITGTVDQTELIQQAIKAVKDKVKLNQYREEAERRAKAKNAPAPANEPEKK